jgi:histidinol-phosphate phosphatase family protein
MVKAPLRGDSKQKAVFLDRDGTLNDDPGYLNHPDQVVLLPQVGEALQKLKAAGFLLIVISNQSGVGRGLIQAEALPKIHARLNELLRPWSVQVDDFGLCFHVPTENCDCRKPKPGLICDMVARWNIDLSRSYFVGDRISDLEAGRAAGCGAVALVKTGDGVKTYLELRPGDAAFVGESLMDVAEWILGR